MSPASSARKGKKSPPPGDTGQESLYLRFLSEKQVPITVKLRDGESVQGWIEYFDDKMIRLTRDGKANLFIYKHQIKTITENAKRRRAPRTSSVAEAKKVTAGIPVAIPVAIPVDGAKE